MIDEIKNSLNSNLYLSNDLKENLLELIVIFNSRFPDVNLTNLNERIKTVKVLSGSRFIMRGLSKYYPETNEITISRSISNKDIDCKHILMRELLNMMSANGEFTGFNKDNMFEALNIGYTELLTNFLVGNEYDSEYEEEVIAADIVMQMVDSDTMMKAYFTNDVSLILKEVS